MIAIKPTVADLYHRQTSVEDIQRQLRLDNPHCTEAEIEIRQVHEATDFGDAFTPELKEAEERMATQMAANAK